MRRSRIMVHERRSDVLVPAALTHHYADFFFKRFSTFANPIMTPLLARVPGLAMIRSAAMKNPPKRDGSLFGRRRNITMLAAHSQRYREFLGDGTALRLPGLSMRGTIFLQILSFEIS